MKTINKYLIEIILILIIVFGILLLSSCERPEYPNLLIGNHFATGQLYVIDTPTKEIVISETFQLWDEKYLYLDLGTYKARLVADYGDDPTRQDRTIIVHIPSKYCQIKILFK